jgi:hypothetical protein
MALPERWSRMKFQHALHSVPPMTKYANIESMKLAIASALTLLRPFLSTLKPSFLGRQPSKPRSLHPTSYLNGLRGVAALFVVFNHYVSQYFPYITHGWRSDKGGDAARRENDRFIQLPVIRAVYSGRFMVTIFFVISGYVLSHKALGEPHHYACNFFVWKRSD